MSLVQQCVFKQAGDTPVLELFDVVLAHDAGCTFGSVSRQEVALWSLHTDGLKKIARVGATDGRSFICATFCAAARTLVTVEYAEPFSYVATRQLQHNGEWSEVVAIPHAGCNGSIALASHPSRPLLAMFCSERGSVRVYSLQSGEPRALVEATCARDTLRIRVDERDFLLLQSLRGVQVLYLADPVKESQASGDSTSVTDDDVGAVNIVVTDREFYAPDETCELVVQTLSGHSDHTGDHTVSGTGDHTLSGTGDHTVGDTCHWHVRRVLSLTPLQLDLSQHENCILDAVTLQGGNSRFFSRTGRDTGSQLLLTTRNGTALLAMQKGATTVANYDTFLLADENATKRPRFAGSNVFGESSNLVAVPCGRDGRHLAVFARWSQHELLSHLASPTLLWRGEIHGASIRQLSRVSLPGGSARTQTGLLVLHEDGALSLLRTCQEKRLVTAILTGATQLRKGDAFTLSLGYCIEAVQLLMWQSLSSALRAEACDLLALLCGDNGLIDEELRVLLYKGDFGIDDVCRLRQRKRETLRAEAKSQKVLDELDDVVFAVLCDASRRRQLGLDRALWHAKSDGVIDQSNGVIDQSDGAIDQSDGAIDQSDQCSDQVSDGVLLVLAELASTRPHFLKFLLSAAVRQRGLFASCLETTLGVLAQVDAWIRRRALTAAAQLSLDQLSSLSDRHRPSAQHDALFAPPPECLLLRALLCLRVSQCHRHSESPDRQACSRRYWAEALEALNAIDGADLAALLASHLCLHGGSAVVGMSCRCDRRVGEHVCLRHNDLARLGLLELLQEHRPHVLLSALSALTRRSAVLSGHCDHSDQSVIGRNDQSDQSGHSDRSCCLSVPTALSLLRPAVRAAFCARALCHTTQCLLSDNSDRSSGHFDHSNGQSDRSGGHVIEQMRLLWRTAAALCGESMHLVQDWSRRFTASGSGSGSKSGSDSGFGSGTSDSGGSPALRLSRPAWLCRLAPLRLCADAADWRAQFVCVRAELLDCGVESSFFGEAREQTTVAKRLELLYSALCGGQTCLFGSLCHVMQVCAMALLRRGVVVDLPSVGAESLQVCAHAVSHRWLSLTTALLASECRDVVDVTHEALGHIATQQERLDLLASLLLQENNNSTGTETTTTTAKTTTTTTTTATTELRQRLVFDCVRHVFQQTLQAATQEKRAQEKRAQLEKRARLEKRLEKQRRSSTSAEAEALVVSDLSDSDDSEVDDGDALLAALNHALDELPLEGETFATARTAAVRAMQSRVRTLRKVREIDSVLGAAVPAVCELEVLEDTAADAAAAAAAEQTPLHSDRDDMSVCSELSLA